jgi:hypothetical protein
LLTRRDFPPGSRLLQQGSPAAAAPALANSQLRGSRGPKERDPRQLAGEYPGCLLT